MTATDREPIRRSQLPPTPPPEWDHHTWFPTPDGGGDLVPGQHSRGVLIRRRVTWGDWEPVHPDHWAAEPERDEGAPRPTRIDLFQCMAETAARAVNNALAADQTEFALAPSPAATDAHPLARLRDRLIAERDQAIRNAQQARHEQPQLVHSGIAAGLDTALQLLVATLDEAGDRSPSGPRAGDPSAAGRSTFDPSDDGVA